MDTTHYVCSVCGETTAGWEHTDDWLIASVPHSTRGEMVIRCPEHITEYAIRKAGGHTRTTNDGQRVGVVHLWEYDLPARS